MIRAHIREIAAGLMTAAMALPLATAPSTYTLSDNATVLGLAVAGSPGTNAGMTVAIPVSGGNNEQANKPHRRIQIHPKHTGS
jgi:hypothetical protein